MGLVAKDKQEIMEVFFVLNGTLEIMSIGPGFEILTGYPLSKCFGKPLPAFFEPGQSDELVKRLTGINSDSMPVPVFLLHTQSSKKLLVKIMMQGACGGTSEQVYVGSVVSDTHIGDANHKITPSYANQPEVESYGWPEGYWDWDIERDTVRFSYQWSQMLGYEHGEIKVEHGAFLNLMQEDDIASFMQKMEEAKLGNQEMFLDKCRLRHKEGHYVDIFAMVAVVRNEVGQAVRLVGIHRDISNIEHFDQQLKRSEDRFKGIFESIVDVYYRTDENGIIMELSPSVEELLGYKPHELIGVNLSSLYTFPKQRDEFLKQIIAQGRLDNHVVSLQHRKGHEVFTSSNTRAIFDVDRHFHGVFGTVRNVTEKIHAEQRLMESEERYKMLSNLTFEGIIVHERGLLIEANQSFCDITGYRRKELIGKNIIKLAVPKEYHALIVEKINSNDHNPYEAVGMRKNGELFPIELEARETFYKGRKVRVTAVRDITARKKTQTALQLSEEKFRSLIESIDGVFWIKNMQTHSTEYISPQYARIWGSAVEDHYKDPKDFIRRIHPDDLKKMEKAYQDTYQSKTFNSEYRIISASGEVKHIRAQTHLSYDRSGKVLREYGYAEDFTAWKASEAAMKERNQQLEKTNQELDNFVYRVSHDLKSPISSAKGLIHIARMEKETAKVNECLRMIENSMDKLDTFILDILDYSRNARMAVVPEKIDIASQIDDILKSLEYIPNSSNVETRVNITGDVDFYSDKRRLNFVLNNLVTNAFRFYDPAKAHPLLQIDVHIKPEQLQLQVQDNGIGIGEEHLDRIFDMFYRATDTQPGSGLGLYIAKEAVEKLGGKIDVESRLGLETIFRIVVPNELESGSREG